MKTLTKAQIKANERQEAIDKILNLVKPNQKVYTSLKYASGMSRQIAVYVFDGDSVHNITYWASKVLDYKVGSKDGLVVGGCGMDMGFSVVYSLGSSLWPNGTTEPHGRRNGVPDSDGGYALKHSWL